ncbi:hypothetical protein WJX72_010305 [[Myrmecia] bisecta]|uniref:RCK N-terminal domain-containing protein n=1 Tax=[Myrmecia] bisecta TaxID=41462 RepID=A0AAW1PD10_9CHLO
MGLGLAELMWEQSRVAPFRRWRCPHAAQFDASSSNGASKAEDEAKWQVKVPENVDTPEELLPLMEALERARNRRDEATAIREALEAEAQEVAQLSINAKDAALNARRKVDDAVAEAEPYVIVKHKLLADLADLQRRLGEHAALATSEAIEASTAQQANTMMDTVDLDVSGHPPRDEGYEVEGDTDEDPTSLGRTERELLQAELQEKTRQLESVSKSLVDLEAKAEVQEKTRQLESVSKSLVDREAKAEMQEKTQQLESVSKSLVDLEAKVADLEARAEAAEAAAHRAEEIASAAMQAAEGAVREEMEAAAVAKSTQGAMSRALAELRDLESSFEESDDKNAKELARAKAKAQKEAEAALELALAASGTPAAKLATGTEDARKADAFAEQKASASTQKEAEPSDMLPALLKHKWLAAIVAVSVLAIALHALKHTAFVATLASYLHNVGDAIAQIPDAFSGIVARLPLPELPEGEKGLLDVVWLLLTSVIAVPLVTMIPGGSAVLGFLAGGAIIGPHALGIIRDVEGVRHIAELGVVFLLFNIGLELSLERLRSMQKYVFGMGTAQVVATLAAVAYTAMAVTGVSGPAAVILGGGLALSSTAVAMQVLQDRGETGSRHGRATFAVLLLQDLAVVVLLMLVPLLAPGEGGEGVSGTRIAKALGIAAIKAVTCIVAIIAGGRMLLRPIYRRIADLANAEIFAATTLLVVLGTSVMTQLAGLSLALGAFLAGLLLAETEFALQVESDIAPYKGLLMGLFFMTVGMEISVGLFFAKWKTVLAGITLLVVGKVAVMAGLGSMFGLSQLQSVRAGLLLAAGGEFAFVTFGEAVHHKILPAELVSQLFLVVALSMAITPFLAELGSKLGKMFEKSDMKALQPNEGEVEELRDHVIIAGFGRVGQIIAQLLSERLIPFVALDVNAGRVQAGKELDLPVYFGDAGSPAVLHSVGAHRAACAVITLDTPGANYRSVWALHKHYPGIKTYVRAHDVDHGINLEKAGATAVVPETLEPSLQLAAAVLSELNMPTDEVAQAIANFRRTHLAELQVLCKNSGSTLGYGFSTVDDDDEPLVPLDIDALRVPPPEILVTEAVP